MATMDVLKALDELKDAGVEERSARAMIRLVSDAVELQAATKVDLERESLAIRSSLAQATAELRDEIAQATTELRNEMAQVAADLRGKIAKATAGLRSDTSDLRLEMLREMSALRDSTNTRLLTVIGLQFGGTALLLGCLYALLR